MSSNAVNAPIQAENPVILWLWYGGSDALFQGEAVCYNADHGTATDADASRANRVERPNRTNNRDFAGVAARNYSARAGGQWIEVYGPGSKSVPVALGVDATIGSGVLTFVVGSGGEAGRFYTGKYRGRGSAIPRQTKAAVVEAAMDGSWSLATDGVTLTVADTSGLARGDTVVLLGGEDEGSSKKVVPGKYEIESVTDGTTLVLKSSAVGAEPGAALTCTGYAYKGNPVVLADLLDGEESGGVEFASIPNAGGDNQPHMAGGVTYICGGVTLAADGEFELAQGAFPGEKKAFVCLGTLTTSDAVVDLVTAGVALTRSSEGALVSLSEVNAIDAAGDACYLEFHGALWHLQDLAGGATAA